MKTEVFVTYLAREDGRISLRSRHAEYRGSSVRRETVEAAIAGPVPELGEYQVRYALDPKGDYYVLPDSANIGWHPRIIYISTKDAVRGMIACALPREWKGKHVTREIVKPTRDEAIF